MPASVKSLRRRNTRNKRSISRALTVALTSTVLAVSVVSVSLIYLIASIRTKAQLEARADEYIASLTGVLEIPLWELDELKIRGAGEAYVQSELVEKLRITDNMGNAYFDFERESKASLVSRASQVFHKGQWVGYIEISLTAKYYTEINRRLLFSGIGMVFVTILVVVIVTGFILRMLLNKPLDSLGQIVNAYASGRYDSSEKKILFEEFQPLVDVLADMGDKITSQMTELRNAEMKYRSIVENAVEGIFQSTPEGRFLSANPSMARVLGYDSPEELMESVANIGQQLYVVPARREGFLQPMRDHQTVSGFHAQLYRKDGSIVWASLHARPVFDENGELLLMEGILQDISESMRAEEELKRNRDNLEELVAERTADLLVAKEQAEAASQAKSAFLANMSHELRTPLNAILGYAQVLLRQQGMADKQKDQVITIYRSGEHLLGMINDILDLARIEARKLELEPTEFQLPALISEVMSIIQVKAEQKNLLFQYEQSPSVPGGVRADAMKLRQVLLNLLDNAIKYTRHGGITLRVAGVGNHPGTIRFEVEDTGIGIPEEMLGEIFEPFAHGKGDGGARTGVGLGLSISRRLVELMGGTLTVQSEVGKGSTFGVELNLEVAGNVVEGQAPAKRIVDYRGERKKVLIVDDNKTNLAVLVAILESLGFEIHTAESGEEAVDVAAAATPDLILMDLLMPGIDGLEAVRRIRAIGRLNQIRVIGISAAVVDRARSESFARVCNDFLSKPVEMAALLESVGRQLGLEWVEGEPAQPVPRTELDHDQEAIQQPPRVALEEIASRMDRGDYCGLEKLLEDLVAEDRDYACFCNRIRQYAKEYDEEAILRFIALERRNG